MKDKKPLGTQGPRQTPNPANQARNSLPWNSLEQQVVHMQKLISQASQRGDRQALHTLQQQLVESEAARLLAVRRVIEENQGKHTAGVDGVKSLTAQERLAMASAIHPSHWNHQPSLPVRRVWIPKPGTTERRPLAILPMIDRCKQALVKLALEPEWEVRFEAHSYGFRPGRGTHDAIAAILVAIERRPSFVFDADIEGAFDHINQAVMLDKLQTYPALKQAITAWLKVGVMDGGTYFPSDTGIPQGGALSPLLMNVALHGMEAVVTEGSIDEGAWHPQGVPQHVVERPLLVRYADDFVIVHADLKELQQAVRRVKHWLARMGLQLHADKTRITHTLTSYQGHVGFDFLGFTIRQEPLENKGGQERSPGSETIITSFMRRRAPAEHSLKVKSIIIPSQEASKRHLATIDQKLRQLHTAPQARVIAELNPLIAGWAAYYNGVVEASIMGRYDDLMKQRLLTWASTCHPGKGREWLLSRYWQRVGNERRVFATSDGVQLRRYRQTSILKG